ncbi:MAG TPA: glycosyltransferase family 39 protein [Candidatus Brocadiia bacterium]|nr:glycosyltransferase family 39 protein [Candidatus Brocadiia bacterium]
MTENLKDIIETNPAPEIHESDRENTPGFIVGGCVILLVCLMTMGMNMRTRSLWEPEEMRYAQIASEMLQNREWALLRFNGILYPDKPPLYFWSICAVASFTGEVGPVAARLPVVVAGIATTLLIYFWVWYAVGLRPALLTAAVLLASPFYLRTASEARMDMLLVFFITLANVAFYVNHMKGGEVKWLHRVFWVSLALGTLVKGPVAIILPLLLAAAFLLMEKELGYFRLMRPLEGIGIIAVLVGLWLVAACVKGGSEFTSNLLLHQNVHRVTDPWLHRNPPWHFIVVLPLLFLPWTFLLPAAIVHPWTAEGSDDRRETLFALLWLATGFIFFTIVPTKRSIYMAPLFPALAVLCGIVIEDCVFKEPHARFWRARIPFYLIPVFLFSLVAAAWGLAPAVFPDCKEIIPELAVPLATGCVVAAFFFMSDKFPAGALTLFATVTMECVIASHIIYPWGDRFKSVKPMLEAVRKVVGDEEFRVFRDERTGYAVYWDKPIPIVRRADTSEGTAGDAPRDYFKEDRAALREYLKSPDRVWILLRQKHLRELNDDDFAYYPVWSHWVGDREHVLASNRPIERPKPEAQPNVVKVSIGGGRAELSATPCGLVSASDNGIILRAFTPEIKIEIQPGEAADQPTPSAGAGRISVTVTNISRDWTDLSALPEGVKAEKSDVPCALRLSIDASVRRTIRLGLRGGKDVPVAVLGQLCGLTRRTPMFFDLLVESLRERAPAFAVVAAEKVCFAQPGEFRLLDERMMRMGLPVYAALSGWDRGNADATLPEHAKRFGLPPMEFLCNGYRCMILDSSLGSVPDEQLPRPAQDGEGLPLIAFTATSPVHPEASSLPAAGPQARLMQALKAARAARLYCGGFEAFRADERPGFPVIITGGTLIDWHRAKPPGSHWILAKIGEKCVEDTPIPLMPGIKAPEGIVTQK